MFAKNGEALKVIVFGLPAVLINVRIAMLFLLWCEGMIGTNNVDHAVSERHKASW